jgi:hypothetical protein
LHINQTKIKQIMTREITTEWTLNEIATLRMAIADRIREMRDDNIQYNTPEFQTMRGLQSKIVLMHEDMVHDNI